MSDGDRQDAPRIREILDTEIYPDLKKLAHVQLAGERPVHTLNTTAIVHEAFVRLAGSGGGYNNRMPLQQLAVLSSS